MLKKEISDVLKQTAIFIVFLFALPAFLVFTNIIVPEPQPYFSVFFPLFQFGLLSWAFFMGASLFSVEQGQRGMEYLLSLPFSRYKLAGLKILPRFISILLFYIVFLIIYLGEGTNHAALSLVSFTTIYFSFYLISLSLSASSDNFLVLFVVSLFSLFIFLGLGLLIFWLVVKMKGYIYYDVEISPFITGELESFIVIFIFFIAFCLLLPLLVAFILSIKKFDIRPSRVYNMRFIKFLAPLFVLGLLVSFFFAHKIVYIGESEYYLTRDYKLIEHNYYSGLKIYDGKKVHKIQEPFFFYYPFAEKNQYVYGETYATILRIDTSDYSVDTLYESTKGKLYGWGGPWMYKQTIAFTERKWNYTKRQSILIGHLILIDEPSKKIKRIPLDTSPVKGYYNLRIFGAGQSNGNQFWLESGRKYDVGMHVFRLWEDGRVEDLGKTRKYPAYINHLLITYSKKEIIVLKEKEGQFEEIQRIPNPKDYTFGLRWYGYWGYLGARTVDIPVKEIFGWKSRPGREETEKKGPIWARLDLETFEIEDLSDTKDWLYCIGPDERYFKETDFDAGTFKIYKYQDGKSQLLRSFRLDFRKSFYPYGVFESGIVLQNGKKVKVYA
ncbi:MAG: hypothetical protein KAT69_10450, partial [Candidatus Aminicenantes bacterium]|nr:hypothetical protein [Candidatus Aminicenantes bacterium]